MAPNTNPEVLRIPCHDSPMFLMKLPLINIGPGGINKDECNDLEKQLLRIPNVKALDNSEPFRWANRKLVNFTKNDARHGRLNGDYMMYMCLDEDSKLPHNRYLEELVRLGRGPKIPTVPFNVYGDAFVFRMESKSKEANDRGPATYVDMDSDFIDSALSREPVGTWAYCLLRMLLLCPHKEA